MNTYTTKEKLLALQLLGMARQSVALYAQPKDCHTAAKTALRIAMEYAATGADYTVLKVLDYPDTERAL